MTKQDIIDAVVAMTEGRAKRLDLSKLINFEIQRICNRKRYWWRKKTFSFSSVVGTATYDLSDSAVATDANDFTEMVQLTRVDAANATPEVPYESDPLQQQAALATTETGDPSRWFLEPGTSQTIRLSPSPNAVKTYRGIYWATPAVFTDDPMVVVPLIPLGYHYVVTAALTRRVFFYLFGQGDPRYVSAERDFEVCMADLDSFRGPATREAIEFRSSSSHDVVRSTS